MGTVKDYSKSTKGKTSKKGQSTVDKTHKPPLKRKVTCQNPPQSGPPQSGQVFEPDENPTLSGRVTEPEKSTPE